MLIKPFYSGNPQMGILVNSECTDEMLNNAAFHLGLHCLMG